MPYRYGGYVDLSELQQAAGGNPWYNPMSKYPDIGGGIRSLVNQMMLMKQAKEQRMQQEEEAKRKAAKEAEEARRWRLEYLQKADAARRQYELAAGKQEPKVQPQFDPALLDTLEKKLDLPKGSMKSLTPDILKQTMGEYAKAKLAPQKPKEEENRGKKLTEYYNKVGKVNLKYMEKENAIKQDAAKASLKDQTDAMKSGIEEIRQVSTFRRGEQTKSALANLAAQKQAEIDLLNKEYAEWLPPTPQPPKTQAAPAKAPQIKITGTVKESSLPAGTQVYEWNGQEVVKVGDGWKILSK